MEVGFQCKRNDGDIIVMQKEQTDEMENCFVIMPISDQGDYPKGHFQKVYEQIFQPAIEKAGYLPYRVDENVISDRIIDKIFDAIQDAPMALCDLSNRNPNVLYELGIRQAYDKPVVLVQDDKTERIFDVSGISTVQYKSQRLYEDVLDAREKITKALVETKEGRQNSIVKILQAKTAQIPSGEVSAEQKIEIMLSGIMSDIKELKTEKSKLENYNLDQDDKLYWYDKKLNVKTFIIQIKQGTTNYRIANEIQRLERRFNGVIEFKRKGEFLTFKSSSIPVPMMEEVYDLLNSCIGVQ